MELLRMCNAFVTDDVKVAMYAVIPDRLEDMHVMFQLLAGSAV